jgi:starvation-inducible DNA-binding protein
MGMVEALVIGHETAAATARSTLATAETADDAASADLATRRIDVHEKTAWMLRSMLD